MIRSFYWHDYETFGVDPVHDRPSQFAGVRTDADLNIIEDPLVIYCKPADDYLPSPPTKRPTMPCRMLKRPLQWPS